MEEPERSVRCLTAVAAIGLCLALTTMRAYATENGGSSYPQGPEYHLSGVLPPPGDYFGDTANVYTADHANDSHGPVTPPDFQFTVIGNIFGYAHVTDQKIFDADWAVRIIAPVLYIHLRSAGNKSTRFGVSNVTLEPVLLGWHSGNWHWMFSPDIYTPDFSWKKNTLNVGQGYWTVSPMFAISYWDPESLNASLKLMYDYDFTNPESHYHSGQEFHFDYEAGWWFGKINIGPSGYFDQQTTDDMLHGARVGDGNRGMAFAGGPTIRYDVGAVELEGAWQHEFITENRIQGEKFWLRVHFAL